MEFSASYSRVLSRVFTFVGEIWVELVLNSRVAFDEYNVLNRMIVTDISTDEIEIPVFLKASIENIIANISSNIETPVDKIVTPLYVNTSNISLRTSDSIIRKFFSRTNFNDRLQMVTTPKGDVYYGNQGIILDKNFKPIILCSVKCRKIDNNRNAIMEYYKPIIHISPEVFINKSDLICKSIINKIIPYYIINSVPFIGFWSSKFRSNVPDNTKPEIIIGDISDFIKSPATPTPSSCSDEAINKLLIDNIEEVIRQL